MLNLQLSYLQFLSEEHPKDIQKMVDLGFKEKMNMCVVQLLYKVEKDQNFREKADLESVDLSGVGIDLDDNNSNRVVSDMTIIHENIEDLPQVLSSLKFKKKDNVKQSFEKDKHYVMSNNFPDKFKSNEPENSSKMKEEINEGFYSKKDSGNEFDKFASTDNFSNDHYRNTHYRKNNFNKYPGFMKNQNYNSYQKNNQHFKNYYDRGFQRKNSSNNGSYNNFGPYQTSNPHNQNIRNTGNMYQGNNMLHNPPIAPQMQQNIYNIDYTRPSNPNFGIITPNDMNNFGK